MSKTISNDKRAPRAERIAQHRANMQRLGEILARRKAARDVVYGRVQP